MSVDNNEFFYTYKTGKLTIIGFDGSMLAHDDAERCRDALLALVNNHACEVLVVDLMDVPIITSWILGILAAIRQHGTRVELYHPSADMREILDTTHLDRLLHVREVV
jgi:anti-anti-sigma factor